MKRTIISLAFALVACLMVNAQQISVVNGSSTQIYTDLNLAIQGAAPGSTIYLSGGGFHLNDTVKIKKKLTIIGIGHRTNNENADGNTMVTGNFHFEAGADNSSVLGIYLTGNVNIGTGEHAVNNFLLRYCNVNSVQVGNSVCQGVLINQNYIRNTSNGGSSAIRFTNNILHSLWGINGGIIENNVIKERASWSCGGYGNSSCLKDIHNSVIKNNVLRGGVSSSNYCSGPNVANDVISNNLHNYAWGDNCVVTENWAEVFVGPDQGVNPNSNFRLKDDSPGKNAGTDGTDIGIYGGSGFSDTALPPGPRIVRKKIADQTDANGNLRVEVEVKIGE